MNLPDCAAFLNALQVIGLRHAWFLEDSECYEALEVGKNCVEAWDRILTRAKEDKELAESIAIINDFLRKEVEDA